MVNKIAYRIRAIRRFFIEKTEGWLSRSKTIAHFLKRRMGLLFILWLISMLGLAIVKIGASPTPAHSATQFLELLFPYVLATLAPAAGFLLARAAFPIGSGNDQPTIRLSRWGKWRTLTHREASQNAAYGPAGLVTTILVGLLVNVAVRTLEFAVAVPSMSSAAPEWGRVFMVVMTLDLVLLNFFYMVCFSMAIRAVPLFPRMLVFTWLIDIQMQLVVASVVGKAAPPANVAAALTNLLDGNIQKILLSMFIWLPILILSRRINITYRQRDSIPADK